MDDVTEKADLETILSELRRVTDELEIRNLIARVYLHTDHERDLGIYGENFTEDAVWERVDGRGSGFHLGARLEGRVRIVADRVQTREQGLTGPDSRRRHLVTTVMVKVEEGGTAQARSKFIVILGDQPQPVVISVGSYLDKLLRTEAGWKIAHRSYESTTSGD